MSTPIVHPKPRRHVPTAVVAAIGVVGASTLVALGYAAGITTNTEPVEREMRPIVREEVLDRLCPIELPLTMFGQPAGEYLDSLK